MGVIVNNPESEFLFTSAFTATDWLEAVALWSPAQLSVGKRRAVATLTGYIEDWDKLKACVHWLRGYAWVDEELNLRRERPAQHPLWPNLVCTELLEVTGLQFERKDEVIGADLPYARYKKFKVTASYNAPPYLIYEDGEADTEDERWTTFDPKPYLDYYAVPGGMFEFVADNPAKAWDGQDFPAPRTAIRSQKSLYKLVHYEVPIAFIRDEYGATPKIDAAIGKVSSDVYAGKDIGCWLVDDIDVDIYRDPIVGDIFGNAGRFADVTYILKFFDPESGHATDTTRGWNLELAVDGKGYPSVRKAGTGPKYQSVSIASLFTHWSV